MDSTAPRIEISAPEPFGGPADDLASPILNLLDSLESDPEESWGAFQGLESLDPEIRAPIVLELIAAPRSEGLFRLLHLLGASRDDDVRRVVREALGTAPRSTTPAGPGEPAPFVAPPPPAATTTLVVDEEPPRILRTLATGVDGEGLGAVVVSSRRGGRVSTAAFLCDVRAGVRDVLGSTDDEQADASDRFDRYPELTMGPFVEDVPALAAGLLAGSLMLSGRDTPPAVREWLDATLGPGFHAGAFLTARPEWTAAPVDSATLAECSWRVLSACPGWVDRSPLTFDLAEEISVRERRAAADPHRDAGAYRYLFERRLLHRLELYRRMLLWMAFFWDAAGEGALAQAAGVLSTQLSDEQYAVPSNPFTIALSTRSLHEAQRLLGTPGDPRRG